MRRAVLAAATAVALAGCASKGADPSKQFGSNPQLPAPQQYLFPPMHVAATTPWQRGETPVAAAGLQVKPFALDLQHPRQLYVLPNGDVLVVETDGPPEPVHRPKDIVMGLIQAHGHNTTTKPGMRIVLLRDADGDGVPEVKSVLLDHLISPYGVALVGNQLYVANTDALVRYPYTLGQTRITAPGVKVTDLPGGPIDHHWTKSLTASPDGSKLYVGVGSNSNITENGMEAEKERAAIWEVDAATGAHRLYATGIRNPTGVAFYPGTTQLWAIANERDELGPDLVPDYLTSVKDGGFYGWPYSYYGQHVDPRVQPQRMDLVKQAIPPTYALSSHVAALGLVFAAGARLPGMSEGAFIGEHGSWDRGHLNGYGVVFVPFANGQPAGPPRPVLSGFVGADGKVRGRPVGVAVDRAGALLVADDTGNAVWRVSPR